MNTFAPVRNRTKNYFAVIPARLCCAEWVAIAFVVKIRINQPYFKQHKHMLPLITVVALHTIHFISFGVSFARSHFDAIRTVTWELETNYSNHEIQKKTTTQSHGNFSCVLRIFYSVMVSSYSYQWRERTGWVRHARRITNESISVKQLKAIGSRSTLSKRTSILVRWCLNENVTYGF